MRVLLLSHTCMSRTAGQPKLHALATHSDLELTALVPDKMCTYDQWHEAETPIDPKFRFVVGKTKWQYIRKQWYLLNYDRTVPDLLREIKPDLIDIWEEPWSLTAAQMVYWTRKLFPHAKIITETEQNIYKKLPPPFQQFQDYSLKHTDFMVARNEEALQVLRRKGYSGEARVIPNAVDCSLFEPQTRTGTRKNPKRFRLVSHWRFFNWLCRQTRSRKRFSGFVACRCTTTGERSSNLYWRRAHALRTGNARHDARYRNTSPFSRQ